MAHPIEKLAIANRGEVAVRIIRAAQELGIKTALLHSEADQRTIAFRLADESICIGGPAVSDSYLNIENVLQGALACGADAIHPGFGFLSENSDFARDCEERRIIFVGPSAEAISTFGDKVAAKNLAEKLSVPMIPGYQGQDQTMPTLQSESDKIGYPVIVKVAGGGGGRGLKVARSAVELVSAVESARREGMAAFQSDRVFVEKYLDRAKHIEVQIFGDASGRCYQLLDRECSVQRRHQKIIEEAISPSLREDMRARVVESARALAEHVRYRSAGTVEFLLQDDEFYFMEVNTRLQVEHPVTEMVMGVDLVKSQLLTVMGRPVNFERQKLAPRGHALECRLYAEDSYHGGIPSTGELGYIDFPQGPGRRFEVGVETGDAVTSFYDPMIAKLIVWDETRPRAIQKMLKVIEDTIVFGVRTNLPLLREILRHPEFLNHTMTTQFMQTHFPNGLVEKKPDEDLQDLFQQIERELSQVSQTAKRVSPWTQSWNET